MIKVLIADDSTFMRLFLRDNLVDYGCEVAGEAANGEEAINLYKAHSPDLVLMDITMPGMDGITAVRMICDINPGAKIIMISAMGQQSFIMEALRAGASDFIVKPFAKARVLESLEYVLGLHTA